MYGAHKRARQRTHSRAQMRVLSIDKRNAGRANSCPNPDLPPHARAGNIIADVGWNA